MAFAMKPQPKKARTLWMDLDNPPRCSKCGSPLYVYCSTATAQYRKCPTCPNKHGDTSVHIRK